MLLELLYFIFKNRFRKIKQNKMETYSDSASSVLKTIILPFLIVCGFISNTISFFVMRRIKTSSTAKYMSFLALIDSGVLIVGGLSLCANTSYYNSMPILSVIGCKLIPFMFYSFADFSVLIIVLMTFERFYGVWRPFEANKMSQTKIIRLNLFFGCLFCCLINCHFIFTHSLVSRTDHSASTSISIQQHQSTSYDYSTTANNDNIESSNYVCEYVIWKDFYEIYWIFIDSFIYSFIPSFLIFTLNILIITMLNKADKIAMNRTIKIKHNHLRMSSHNRNIYKFKILKKNKRKTIGLKRRASRSDLKTNRKVT